MSYIIKMGYDEYQDLSYNMYIDTSYKSALKAAILAPSIFMKNINNFEVTFDAIIHHLELALAKATNQGEIELVQLLAQELFHGHIFLVEQKIEHLKVLNQRGLIDKIGSFFKGESIEEAPFTMPSGIGGFAKNVFDQNVYLIVISYFEKLHMDWKISQKSNFFYIQLARIYRKMIASKVYNPNFNLISNTIDRNKNEIANSIIAQSDWDESVEFLAALEYRKPFNFNSLRNTIFNGYRKYFRWKSISSTYFFYCTIFFGAIFAFIKCMLSELGNFEKTLVSIIILITLIFFYRFEHRVIGLKTRIKKRVEELRTT